MKKHECNLDINQLRIVKDDGTMITYECQICGKKISEIGDFIIPEIYSNKKYRVILTWKKDLSKIKQIAYLKRVFPQFKQLSYEEILKLSGDSENWQIGEYYEREANEYAKLASNFNLNLHLEEIV